MLDIYSPQELENVLRFPRPRLTVDIVVYNRDSDTILLQKRNLPEPKEYFGTWALPGGHVNKGEDYRAAARRELKEEMGLEAGYLDLIDIYTTMYDKNFKEIDSRGWRATIAVLWTPQTKKEIENISIDNDEVSGYTWTEVDDILSEKVQLAFNHLEIIKDAVVFGLLT